MRKIGFLLLLCLISAPHLLLAQTHLKAKVLDAEDGTIAYVLQLDKDGQKFIPADTVKVKNGEIDVILPKVRFQTINALRFKDNEGYFYFFNENTPIEASICTEDFNKSTIEESGESTQLFASYQKYIGEIGKELEAIFKSHSSSELTTAKVQTEINQKKDEIGERLASYRKDKVQNHPNSLASAYILSDMMRYQDYSKADLKSLFQNLSMNVRRSNIGKQIKQVLDPKASPAIGDIAPNFSGPTPFGGNMSLKEELAKKGKYTLVEFWASWCPKCQAEMPNVVKVYKKYHDKGLNIISVSVDKDKGEWINAIKGFGMDWDHVSHLKHWDEPIAADWGVQSIPQNFLLDQNGKVIGTHLIGKALDNKMHELLGEAN